MSSNDKTQQKLMESMRKTKSGATKKTDQPKSAESRTKVADNKPVKTTTDSKVQLVSDPYQSRPRVWPD